MKWENLPENMQNEAVRPYFDILKDKKSALIFKRIFDIFASSVLIVLSSPVLLFLSMWIKLDSKGPVLYKSERVTKFGKSFKILKFRTMVVDADKKGSLITVSGDSRITRVGAKIRRLRLDELPQLFNVFVGQMSFVGTRPEVRRYVDCYTDEMLATLLLPAGVTSPASILYRDEDEKMAELTKTGLGVDEAYVKHILPDKMKHNLAYIKDFGFFRDIIICIKTVI